MLLQFLTGKKTMSKPEKHLDTHCHLDAAEFAGKREKIITAARRAGVCRFIVPGVALTDWQRLHDIAARFSGVYTAPGVHPLFTEGLTPPEVTAALEKQLALPKVVAIGEIGLDAYQSSSQIDMQIPLFKAQTELAISAKLPLLLHIRKAHDVVLSILRKLRYAQQGSGGVVHAYSGSLQQAEQFCQMGFCLGIGGMLLNPRARRIKDIVRQMPIAALVLETDAPYMKTEPQAIPSIAQYMAELRGEKKERVLRGIAENNSRIFKNL